MSGSLQRFTHPVDGTIPIPALLYRDEEEYASQDGVGIYDGCVLSQVNDSCDEVDYWIHRHSERRSRPRTSSARYI